MVEWRGSAGAVTVLESTMRNGLHKVELPGVIHASEIAARMVQELRNSTDPRAVHAMASMASTVRKVMYTHSLAYTTTRESAAQIRQGALASTPAAQRKLRECGDILAVFVRAALAMVVYIDCTIEFENGNKAAHLRFAGVSDQRGRGGSPVSQTRTLLLQRALLALLLCLLQAVALQARVEYEENPRYRYQSEWYADVKEDLCKLGGDLGPMSRMMMQAPEVWGSASRETISASIYESFTTPACRQVFLQGCCHLSCTSLDGPSEAALETLLCSGCMRARYCSVGCQRAAWVQGHRLHCGAAQRSQVWGVVE